MNFFGAGSSVLERRDNLTKVGRLNSLPAHHPIIWGQRLGKPECPYMRRWALDFKLFSIRLHHWYASDDQRYTHDHPWDFICVILKGGYMDVTEQGEELMNTWWMAKRKAEHKHIVKVLPGGCWSLLLTGRAKRRWGFWVNGKFIEQRRYFFRFGQHPCEQPSRDSV